MITKPLTTVIVNNQAQMQVEQEQIENRAITETVKAGMRGAQRSMARLKAGLKGQKKGVGRNSKKSKSYRAGRNIRTAVKNPSHVATSTVRKGIRSKPLTAAAIAAGGGSMAGQSMERKRANRYK